MKAFISYGVSRKSMNGPATVLINMRSVFELEMDETQVHICLLGTLCWICQLLFVHFNVSIVNPQFKGCSKPFRRILVDC